MQLGWWRALGVCGWMLACAVPTTVRAEAPAASRATLLSARRAASAQATRPRAKVATSTKPSAKPSPAAIRAERLGLGTIRSAGRLLAGRPEAHWIPGRTGDTALFGSLRFPVTGGGMSRGFGSGKGGYHQAMDIVAPLGSKVRAAAKGLVGYAGDGIRGYGNMVLIVHEGGAVTLYAHNQKNLVVAGERVEKGALIALLGSTGRSKGPHVHFELLYGGQNCDPGPLLRPAVHTGAGKSAGFPQSFWKAGNKRPKSVRCAPRKHHPDYVPAREEESGDGDDAPEAP